MANSEKIQRKKRAMNPKSLANLKPFKKGESGNPDGKPLGARNRSTTLRPIVEMIAEFVNPITKAKEPMMVETRMDYAIIGEAMKGNVRAWEAVKDTLYGKIANKEEHSGPDGGPQEHTVKVILPKE